MRKAILLENEGGRLGNQLWVYISIYAYCLEKGYECRNYSFWKYGKWFAMKNINAPADYCARYLPGRLSVRIYNALVRNIKRSERPIIFSGNHIHKEVTTPFYLPPSKPADEKQAMQLQEAEKAQGNILLSGWLFRNPIGIATYHSQIAAYFQPRRKIRQKIDNFTKPILSSYQTVIGVHIRKQDYRQYENGRLYFSEKEVATILHHGITVLGKNLKETAFIICSDDIIEKEHFADLNAFYPEGNPVEDLFTLAKTQLIIGSDSTFGSFAAYHANVPIVFFERDEKKMNWKAAKEKEYNYYNNSFNIQH